jgi:hypothetical protein
MILIFWHLELISSAAGSGSRRQIECGSGSETLHSSILYPRLFIPGPYPAIQNGPNSILDPFLLNHTVLPKLKK